MMDALFVAVTLVFFALAMAYVAGCDRLAPSKASGPKSGGAS